MSREIDDLETKLGGKQARRKMLLTRKKNGSQLTRAGQQICQEVRGVLARLGELQITVSSGRSMVRIGLTNTLATNFFPRVLAETTFLADFPKVDLEIVEGEPHELVGLLNSRVDFAVGPKDVNNGFASRPLCEWRRVLLYSRHVSYQHDFSRTPSAATLREWIREENLMVPAPLIIPKLSQFLKPMTTGRILIVPQAAVRRHWVERGLGLAISYEEKRRVLSLTDPIGTIDLSQELGTTEMHLYQRPGMQLSEPAAFLVDAVTAIFNREQSDEQPRRAIR
jgi:DNA-binding transcriptional LysR family regulator